MKHRSSEAARQHSTGAVQRSKVAVQYKSDGTHSPHGQNLSILPQADFVFGFLDCGLDFLVQYPPKPVLLIAGFFL